MLTKGFNLAIIDKREEVYLWRRTMNKENLALDRFQGNNIKDISPCGKGYVTGVPYARDYYLAHPEVLSTGKTRTLEGSAAEKLAENFAKFDKETGVLSKVFSRMNKWSRE